MIFRIFQVSFLLLINAHVASMEILMLGFPPVKDASEFGILSNYIYDTSSCGDTAILPDDISCYWCNENLDGAQCVVSISSDSKCIDLAFTVTYSTYYFQVDVSAYLVQYEGPNSNKYKIITREGSN